MKIPPIFEQSICIILLLAVQKDHIALSSKTISSRLQLSDTYTKKVANKLVKNKLIDSMPGKYGGLKSSKSIKQISLLDIYHAVVGEENLFDSTNLAEKVFIEPDVIQEKQQVLENEIDRIQNIFFENLSAFTIDQLLVDRDYVNGYINWEEIIDGESEDKDE
ncbi:Rrf2 family transcriptional regulator [Weissella thailandensis]|uniref:Transcriptional regulator n=1 Tax=Weissella thailandensis TaxID=89061 RepID=A0ABX9I2J3_9LACO|nr:Rrf2 family transcriptional regulator [Weissella thailandensis]NKY91616.1 Rrf2 family transcriptional regulator [Weissella thailandensis]RDS58904.1 transcriptional regulator [Weissella thailandensis]GEP75224.1 hypothetical protein WTH01_14710 [Weissella thailandensis]